MSYYSLVNWYGEIIGEKFDIYEQARAAAENEFDNTAVASRSVVLDCGKIEDMDDGNPSVFKESDEWTRIQEELKQGREAIEKLPKTADAVRVSWGDQVWFYDDLNEKLIWGVIEMIEDIRESDMDGDFMFVGSMPDEEIPFQSPNVYCYSSKEACLESIKKEKAGEI